MIKKKVLLFFLGFAFITFAQQSYYNNVDFSKSGIALKNELANLIIIHIPII